MDAALGEDGALELAECRVLLDREGVFEHEARLEVGALRQDKEVGRTWVDMRRVEAAGIHEADGSGEAGADHGGGSAQFARSTWPPAPGSTPGFAAGLKSNLRWVGSMAERRMYFSTSVATSSTLAMKSCLTDALGVAAVEVEVLTLVCTIGRCRMHWRELCPMGFQFLGGVEEYGIGHVGA